MKNKIYTTVLPILFLIFPAMVLAAAPTGQVTSPKEIDGFVKGAALDPDTLAWPIDVHFYIDCPSAPNTNDCLFIGSAKANESAPVFGNHGFTFRVPEEYLTGNGVKKSLRDGSDHTLTLHGIDTGGGGGVLINNGQPYTFKLVGSPSQIPSRQNSLKYFGYYFPGGRQVPSVFDTGYGNIMMTLNPEYLDLAKARGFKAIINVQNEAFDDTQWFNRINTLLPGGITYRSKIQSGFENGDVIAMAFTDEAWLRGYRNADIERAAARIKATFPNIPILYNEAYSTMDAKDPTFTFPELVDWVSFDHYIRDPRRNDLWMKYYELMKSKRSRPDQKIFIVMNAWWHPSNPFSKEEMAMVAKNYYELAKADPDVIGINAWVWGGYEENRGWVGTRDLPQVVRDAHKAIGNEITGKRDVDFITRASRVFSTTSDKPIKIRARIKNIGTERSVNSTAVLTIDELVAGKKQVFTKDVPTIRAGGKKPVKWENIMLQAPVDTQSTHTYKICANAGSVPIYETNTTNNCISGTFVINQP